MPHAALQNHHPTQSGLFVGDAGPARARLETLRETARHCRAAPRLDFFETCARIDPRSNLDPEAAQHLLVRLLGQALGQQPVFYHPGTAQVSFDERWMLSLLSARLRADPDSVRFLLERRIEVSKRRLFALLLGLMDKTVQEF